MHPELGDRPRLNNPAAERILRKAEEKIQIERENSPRMREMRMQQEALRKFNEKKKNK